MVKRDPTIYIFGSQHVLHYMVNIVGVYVILFLAYAPLQFAGFDIYAHAVWQHLHNVSAKFLQSRLCRNELGYGSYDLYDEPDIDWPFRHMMSFVNGRLQPILVEENMNQGTLTNWWKTILTSHFDQKRKQTTTQVSLQEYWTKQRLRPACAVKLNSTRKTLSNDSSEICHD